MPPGGQAKPGIPAPLSWFAGPPRGTPATPLVGGGASARARVTPQREAPKRPPVLPCGGLPGTSARSLPGSGAAGNGRGGAAGAAPPEFDLDAALERTRSALLHLIADEFGDADAARSA